MNVIYSTQAKEDVNYWQKHNHKILLRIEELIVAIKNYPYSGIGKPEKLRFEWSGYWSRRINNEHRLVYKVFAEDIYIVQCRYHYS